MNSITNKELKEEFWKKFVERIDVSIRGTTLNNEALIIGTADEVWEFFEQSLINVRKEEREEIRKLAEDWIGECTCTPEYKDRGLVDHSCTYHELKGFLDELK